LILTLVTGINGAGRVSLLPSSLFTTGVSDPARRARSELRYEIASGATGLALALFMFGHMTFEASILLGTVAYDEVAMLLEEFWIAQPTVIGVIVLFLVHAVLASRKIPAQLAERKRMTAMAKALRESGATGGGAFRPHVESMLWIWQVRTGMIILVLGSFHLVLVAMDVFTPLYGDIRGIEASVSMERVRAGLWVLYAGLVLAVTFHLAVGLYRLFIKWGADRWLSRRTLYRLEQVIFWGVLVVGAVTIAVLAGVIDPPLAFLLEGS
jgi:fumarate reductase subunit C